MFTEQEKQRMELAKETRIDANCRSTILYIKGALDVDTSNSKVNNGKTTYELAEEYIGQLSRIDSPKEGAILVMRDEHRKEIEHMGLVVQENPVKIYHRQGLNRKVTPSESLDDVIKYYTRVFSAYFNSESPLVEYYIDK